MSSRTRFSFYNILSGVFLQGISFLLSFLIRAVFIKTLGELYLGLDGLFSNLLSFLNLAELGIGTAILIELYRTTAENNAEKSRQYLHFYKKMYRITGMVILAVGLCLFPFLDLLIKDGKALLNLVDYRMIFLLYLGNSVFPYLFFPERIAVFQSNQQEYRLRIIACRFKILEAILQITGLFLLRNIYLFLCIPLFLGCVSTILKGILANKLFPELTKKPESRLSAEEISGVKKNVKAVALYKISGCINSAAGSIILSSFSGILMTGLYSNYLLLTGAAWTLLQKIFNSFASSLGNLHAEKGVKNEQKYLIFKTLSFLNFWGSTFIAVLLFSMFTPLIKLWIGEKFLLDRGTELLLILNFLTTGLQETVGTHRGACGLFLQGKYRPVFSVGMNIAVSVFLVKLFPEHGIKGILAGSILSNLSITFWYDAKIVCKHCFGKSHREFCRTFLFRLILAVFLCAGIRLTCTLWSGLPLLCQIIFSFAAASLLFHGFLFLFFFRTQEFALIRKKIAILKQEGLFL